MQHQHPGSQRSGFQPAVVSDLVLVEYNLVATVREIDGKCIVLVQGAADRVRGIMVSGLVASLSPSVRRLFNDVPMSFLASDNAAAAVQQLLSVCESQIRQWNFLDTVALQSQLIRNILNMHT